MQFFGILTALDCTDDLLHIGLACLIVGVFIGFVARYLLAIALRR